MLESVKMLLQQITFSQIRHLAMDLITKDLTYDLIQNKLSQFGAKQKSFNENTDFVFRMNIKLISS